MYTPTRNREQLSSLYRNWTNIENSCLKCFFYVASWLILALTLSVIIIINVIQFINLYWKKIERGHLFIEIFLYTQHTAYNVYVYVLVERHNIRYKWNETNNERNKEH